MDNQVSLKGVFNWVLKVIDYCFGFAKHRFVIGQKKKTCATFSTIRFKTPSNLDLGTRFPALHAVLLFLIRVLIGSWWCQFSLRLAVVITVFFEIEMKTVLIYSRRILHIWGDYKKLRLALLSYCRVLFY